MYSLYINLLVSDFSAPEDFGGQQCVSTGRGADPSHAACGRRKEDCGAGEREDGTTKEDCWVSDLAVINVH